jgi:hypothetical protein
MPRTREDIQIFSLSFLDLLCCSLASVVILWVLTGRSQPAHPKSMFAFAQIRQRGIWHFAGMEAHSNDGSIFYMRRPGSTVNFEGTEKDPDQFRLDAERQFGLLATMRGPDSDFAGQVLLGATDRTKPAELVVFFEQCQADSDLHTIVVDIESRSTQAEHSFYFTREDLFKSAVQKAAAAGLGPASYPLVPKPSGTDVLQLAFSIDQGTIQFVPVATIDLSHPHDSRR